MQRTDVAPQARCSNVAACEQAAAGAALEWYAGAGEYCPECGEALTLAAPDPHPLVEDRAPARAPQSAPAPQIAPAPPTMPQIAPRPPIAREAVVGKRRSASARRWFWLVAGVCVVGAAAIFAARHDAASETPMSAAVAVCPLAGIQPFAADLLAGYRARNGSGAERLRLAGPDAAGCDIRFSATAETPDAVIARDGIVAIVNPLNPISRLSEEQLRLIYSGAIHDWSQVGAPPGPIVALLPSGDSDEAKALGASLLFGVAIDRGIARAGSSADVTRRVTGADRAARSAIGLVAFSQAVAAKVIPLAYLPPPNVLTIATRRYPYTMTIALRSASHRDAGATAGLIQFARSSDGVAIVQKNGLIPPEGP